MRTTTKLAALAAALVLVAGAGIAGEMAGKAALEIGAKAPAAEVKMKGVDGKEVSIKDVMGAKGTLVVFTCNACPYAKGWETRIVDLGNSYAAKGIGMIAINANDPKVVADDGYDQMVTRAKERGMKYPYVMDATSEVAKAFGAARTPEAFLFDAQGKLVYHGAVDDKWRARRRCRRPTSRTRSTPWSPARRFPSRRPRPSAAASSGTSRRKGDRHQ